MGKPLAIVWDRPHVVAACGGAVHRVEAAEALADAEAVAAVCEAVDQMGATSLVGVVPRDRAAWRAVDAPPMPEGELPHAARLQFASRLASSADTYAVDFVARPAEAGWHLLVVGVPAATVRLFEAVAERLGLPLEAVRLSSGCLADAAPDGCGAAVAAGPATVETVVLGPGGDLLDATARRHDGDRSAALDAERRRLAMTLDDQDARVAVFGTDPPGESDPAAVSALAAAAGGSADWNFAAPRQPAPPRDLRRTAIVGGVAAAVLLAGGVGFGVWSAARDLDDEIAGYRTKIADSEAFLDAKGSARGEAKAVEAYLKQRPPVARVLTDVMSAMPDRERLVFSELELRGGRTRPRVEGVVFGRDRRAIEEFLTRLESLGYAPAPAAVSDAADEGRPGYAARRPLSFPVPDPPKEASDADA